MKAAVLIAAIGTTFAFYACDKDKDQSQQGTIALGQCKSQQVDGATVSLCYDKLVEDSRCPKDAQCIWQGIGVAQFTFTVNNDKHTFQLGTWKWQTYNTDTLIGGYRIHLDNLTPYPGDKPLPASAQVTITRQ